MNTELYQTLLNPEYKSGTIVAPNYSGVTYTLIAKAIALAKAGEEVLFVGVSNDSCKAYGGIVETFLKTLTGSDYRYSPMSMIFTIGEGKIKVTGLEFTLDKHYDTVIFDNAVPYKYQSRAHITHSTSQNCSHMIVSVTPYNFVSTHKSSPLYYRTNLKGAVVEVRPQGTMEVSAGLSKVCNNYGSFKIFVKARNPFLCDLNPIYMKMLDTLPQEEQIRLLSTDLTECYHQQERLKQEKEVNKEPKAIYNITITSTNSDPKEVAEAFSNYIARLEGM